MSTCCVPGTPDLQIRLRLLAGRFFCACLLSLSLCWAIPAALSVSAFPAVIDLQGVSGCSLGSWRAPPSTLDFLRADDSGVRFAVQDPVQHLHRPPQEDLACGVPVCGGQACLRGPEYGRGRRQGCGLALRCLKHPPVLASTSPHLTQT